MFELIFGFRIGVVNKMDTTVTSYAHRKVLLILWKNTHCIFQAYFQQLNGLTNCQSNWYMYIATHM